MAIKSPTYQLVLPSLIVIVLVLLEAVVFNDDQVGVLG